MIRPAIRRAFALSLFMATAVDGDGNVRFDRLMEHTSTSKFDLWNLLLIHLPTNEPSAGVCAIPRVNNQ